MAIHQHLACDHAQIARGGGLEERFDGLGMNGAVDHRRRRPITRQLVEEELGNGACVLEIGEALLGRESVVAQPVEEALTT